jgi:hypothetical protein
MKIKASADTQRVLAFLVFEEDVERRKMKSFDVSCLAI